MNDQSDAFLLPVPPDAVLSITVGQLLDTMQQLTKSVDDLHGLVMAARAASIHAKQLNAIIGTELANYLGVNEARSDTEMRSHNMLKATARALSDLVKAITSATKVMPAHLLPLTLSTAVVHAEDVLKVMPKGII